MIVVLNVGGTNFHTSSETLCNVDGMLSSWVQHQNLESNFIDRDPTDFRLILNFLRGSDYIPTDYNVLKQLRVEADFYLLKGLVQKIDKVLSDIKHPESVEQKLQRILQKMDTF